MFHPKPDYVKRYEDEQKRISEEVFRLFRAGKDTHEIHEILSISEAGAYRILNDRLHLEHFRREVYGKKNGRS